MHNYVVKLGLFKFLISRGTLSPFQVSLVFYNKYWYVLLECGDYTLMDAVVIKL